MLFLDAAAALATSTLFFPRTSAVLQYVLNPITLFALFLPGGSEIADNALIATLWGASHGLVLLPGVALAVLATRLPWHALALSIPLLRQLYVNCSRGCSNWQGATGMIAAFAAVTAVVANREWGSRDVANSGWTHAGEEVHPFWPRVFGRPTGGGALLSAALLQPGWYLRALAFRRYSSFFDALLVAHPLLYAVPLTLRFWSVPPCHPPLCIGPASACYSLLCRSTPQHALAAIIAVVSLLDPTPAFTVARLPLVVSCFLSSPAAIAGVHLCSPTSGINCMNCTHSFLQKCTRGLSCSPGAFSARL